jgi:hypothetical protein
MLEEGRTNDDEMHSEWTSIENLNKAELHLSHGKMECKHGFKYVQNQIRFVYQETILSE